MTARIEHPRLTATLAKQRKVFQASAIHAEIAPVQNYAKQIAAVKGSTFAVVSIPEGSAAWASGYRFVSIPEDELGYYLERGAVLQSKHPE